MRLLSTSIKGYCKGFMFYTNPNRNPVLGIQIAWDHIIVVFARNRMWVWRWKQPK